MDWTVRALLLCIQHLSSGELPSQRFLNKLTLQQRERIGGWRRRERQWEARARGFFNGLDEICPGPELGQSSGWDF